MPEKSFTNDFSLNTKDKVVNTTKGLKTMRDIYELGRKAKEKNELRVCSFRGVMSKYFWLAGYDGYSYKQASEAIDKIKKERKKNANDLWKS